MKFSSFFFVFFLSVVVFQSVQAMDLAQQHTVARDYDYLEQRVAQGLRAAQLQREIGKGALAFACLSAIAAIVLYAKNADEFYPVLAKIVCTTLAFAFCAFSCVSLIASANQRRLLKL